MSMRREGYGAIPQNVAQDGTEDSNLPGPEEVRIIPDKWKQAPLWIFIFIILFSFSYMLFSPSNGRESTFEAVVWESFNTSSLNGVKPISPHEFGIRLDKLSKQLESEGVDAFIAEPGGTTLYYANISDYQWGLTERPFLLVVTPNEVLFLAPLFEVSRAKMLPFPHPDKVKLVTWAEDASPYQTLLDKLASNAIIMLDDNVRSFISQGLTDLNATVTLQSPSVASIREIKSSAEIDILRAVNIATVEALRAIQQHAVLGMSERTIGEALERILIRAGLTPYFNIVLFGDDAANVHGGVDESRQLQKCELILIDVGAYFHGYASDITRTFFPGREDPEGCASSLSLGDTRIQIKDLWQIVYDAQTAGIEALTTEHTCAEVDLAARTFIEDKRLGKYFKHRLGHSIGLEGHERPYLNKGNTKTQLQVGNVFTVEPGVYIEGFAGIRLEDVLVVTENGPELLSGERAKDWLHP